MGAGKLLTAPNCCMAVGQSFAMLGLVSSIILQARFSGGLEAPQRALTFSAFFHTVRLLGGQAGVAFMGHFIADREKLHSNLLGLHVQSGNWITDGTLHGLAAGLAAKSNGIAGCHRSRLGLIDSKLRLQAYSLTFIDAFHLVAWACVVMLLVTAVLRKSPLNFAQLPSLQQGPTSTRREQAMTTRTLLLAPVLLLGQTFALGQQADSTAPRTINLHQAVELALRHNHVVRIASLHVEEEQHAKEVARSAYLPVLRNDSMFVHVTDTQNIEIPAGALGTVSGTAIPADPLVLNQGGKTFETSGTGLTQPLTQLFKIKAGNDVARAELEASRGKARSVENDVALKVRQLYYKILVVQSQHRAIEAKIRAVDDLKSERVQQVKYGSTLEADLIESRAQSLQAKQELLTSELQLSDLKMQFNDVVGLPIKNEVALDPDVPPPTDSCQREECIKLALESHPELAEARAVVEKASAGVRAAKREYIPDVDVFARYSYQNNVPFLARNFGTFGIHFGYDLFEGGKRRATLRERDSQLAQAKENLARISDEVELRVQTAYNKLERTQEMVAVSQELLATREEARRVSAQQLEQGAYLRSQAEVAAAQEFEAQTILLQSQLDYAQAQDELTQAIGQTAK